MCSLPEAEHRKSPVITSLPPDPRELIPKSQQQSLLIKSIKHHHDSLWSNLCKELSHSVV